jgi:NAD-dependent SIR2 family protein deacetylase
MATFTTGKHALAICDRCGQQYKFHQLKQEWNGLKTCPECFETKHPQLTPSYHSGDAQALPWTRPARQEPMTVFVGAPGDSAFTSDGMQPSKQTEKLLLQPKLGKVTIVTS